MAVDSLASLYLSMMAEDQGKDPLDVLFPRTAREYLPFAPTSETNPSPAAEYADKVTYDVSRLVNDGPMAALYNAPILAGNAVGGLAGMFTDYVTPDVLADPVGAVFGYPLQKALEQVPEEYRGETARGIEGLLNASSVVGGKMLLGNAVNSLRGSLPTYIRGFYGPQRYQALLTELQASAPNIAEGLFNPQEIALRRTMGGMGSRRLDEFSGRPINALTQEEVDKMLPKIIASNEKRVAKGLDPIELPKVGDIASPLTVSDSYANAVAQAMIGAQNGLPSSMNPAMNLSSVKSKIQFLGRRQDTAGIRDALNYKGQVPDDVLDYFIGNSTENMGASGRLESVLSTLTGRSTNRDNDMVLVRNPSDNLGESLTLEALGRGKAGSRMLNWMQSESKVNDFRRTFGIPDDLDLSFEDTVKFLAIAKQFERGKYFKMKQGPFRSVLEGKNQGDGFGHYMVLKRKQMLGRKPLTDQEASFVSAIDRGITNNNLEVDPVNKTIKGITSFISGAKVLGGVDNRIMVDYKNNKMYSQILDDHDMLGTTFGENLQTLTPVFTINMRKPKKREQELTVETGTDKEAMSRNNTEMLDYFRSRGIEVPKENSQLALERSLMNALAQSSKPTLRDYGTAFGNAAYAPGLVLGAIQDFSQQQETQVPMRLPTPKVTVQDVTPKGEDRPQVSFKPDIPKPKVKRNLQASTDKMSFSKAFDVYRKMGFDIFEWNGKKYTTQLA